MQTNILIKQINERHKVLQSTSKVLKEQFIGIDEQIDRLIQSITAWYILPDLITKPVIVNLFGPTGTGKTSLVRNLVKELKMNDKFVEVCLGHVHEGDDDEYNNSDTIKNVLLQSSIGENESGILLLDEFQGLKTLDEGGRDIQHDQKKFQDIWTLLSDGKFSNSGRGKNKLVSMLLETLYDEENRDSGAKYDDRGIRIKKNNKKQKYRMSLWEAQQCKKILKLTETVEEVMKWDIKTRINKLYEKIEDESYSEGESYSKLLIVIAGNLDSAYHMASDTGNADIDADAYHEYSKQINVVDIKESLTELFRPEQVSRLGNQYIIYPTISRDSFEKIIKKTISQLTDNIQLTTGIKITIDNTVEKICYDNGVYPAQGIRPLFSTISNILEANIPNFVLKALENKIKEFHISYDNEYLITTINSTRIRSEKINIDLDKIKKTINGDFQAFVSTHEAGHAIAYAVLFGHAPTQLKSAITNWEGGYILKNRSNNSMIQMLDQIQVMYAGQIAEEIVFGELYKGAGSANDILQATTTATNMIRKYGMGVFEGTIYSPDNDNADIGMTNIGDTNKIINKLLYDQKIKVFKLLKKNIIYLKVIIAELLKKGEIKPDEFVKLSKPFIKNITICNAKEVLLNPYSNMLQDFLTK